MKSNLTKIISFTNKIVHFISRNLAYIRSKVLSTAFFVARNDLQNWNNWKKLFKLISFAHWILKINECMTSAKDKFLRNY